jgi:gamma-carbonic anhydrase
MNNLIQTIENKKPSIHESVFLAKGSQVIGDVQILKDASIWNNTIVRGDVNSIKIGKNSNIQDMCMLHNSAESPLIIGENVTIGHNVTLHGCDIKDNCLIGIGSIILDDVIISKFSLVAAGSLVTPGKSFPDYSLIMGRPAKFIRKLTDKEIEQHSNQYKKYLVLKEKYLSAL